MFNRNAVEEDIEKEEEGLEPDEINDVLADTTQGITENKPKKKRKTVGLVVLALTILGAAAVGWYLLTPSEVQVDRTAQQAKAQQIEDAQAVKTEAVNKVIDLYGVPKTDANGKLLAPTAPQVAPSPVAGMTIGAIGTKEAVDPAWKAPAQVSPSPAPTQLAANGQPLPNGQKTQASPTPNLQAGNSQFWGGTNAAGTPAPRTSVPNKNKSVVFDEVEVKKADEKAIKSAAPTGVAIDPKLLSKKTPILGTMLPVTLMGAVYTHGADNLARLHLSRDVSGDGWSFKKGTLFVGKVSGSLQDRAFVNVIGYLDPETNQLVKLGGQVTGDDGGAGLRGNKKRLTPIMGKVLDRLLQSGTQILSARLGRNNSGVYINPNDYGGYNQSQYQNGGQQYFVEVPAGVDGYIMISEIAGSSLSGNVAPMTEKQLSGTEFAEILASGEIDRLRANLPRMSPEMRRAAEEVLRETGNLLPPDR